jgi:hypothetical protein
VSLLITDLDNTLFDWFGIWHASFSAMLDKTVELSGVPREVLEAEWILQDRFRDSLVHGTGGSGQCCVAAKSGRQNRQVYCPRRV